MVTLGVAGLSSHLPRQATAALKGGKWAEWGTWHREAEWTQAHGRAGPHPPRRRGRGQPTLTAGSASVACASAGEPLKRLRPARSTSSPCALLAWPVAICYSLSLSPGLEEQAWGRRWDVETSLARAP